VANQLMESCDEVYLPLLRQQRVVCRLPKWRIEPLFSGYLFARFSVQEQLWTVHHTPGVVNVLGTCDGQPLAVDEAIIAALRQRSSNGYVEIQPVPFLPGEEVEVLTGQFQQMQALFQQELKGGERVAVFLELLSSQVRVELPQSYIQKTFPVVSSPT